MACKRLLPADFFEDEYIGSLLDKEKLLLIGLILSCADDQGRCLDNYRFINGRIFIYDEEISDVEIENCLIKLHNSKTIVRYTVDGKKYLQLVKWWKYQKPTWAMDSRYPPPEGWTDRYRKHTTGNKIDDFNWELEGGFNSSSLCNVQGSQLHSGVDSDIEKNKSRLDKNDNGEFEVVEMSCEKTNDNNEPYGNLIRKYIEKTGIKPGEDLRKWIRLENELLREGIIEDDIEQVLSELANKNNYCIPSSFLKVEKSAKMVYVQRKQKLASDD